MEQNKVLMIIVSVAIFFAAIVGVGVALLYPRDDTAATAARSTTSRGFDPIEYVRRPETARFDESAEDEEPVIIVYGERDEDDPETADESRRVITLEPSVTAGDGTAEDGDSRQPAAAEREPAVSASPDTDSSRDVQGETDTSAGEAAGEATDGTETTAPPSTSGVTERRVEPRRIRVTEYWIQLIASPSKDRVEYAQDLLSDYSLGGRVTTRDVDGELYYRLRVGPYDNHQEAEKFLTWIRDIDGFAEAYISEEYPLRTVNG
jgi:cell division septation protein DedD